MLCVSLPTTYCWPLIHKSIKMLHHIIHTSTHTENCAFIENAWVFMGGGDDAMPFFGCCVCVSLPTTLACLIHDGADRIHESVRRTYIHGCMHTTTAPLRLCSPRVYMYVSYMFVFMHRKHLWYGGFFEKGDGDLSQKVTPGDWYSVLFFCVCCLPTGETNTLMCLLGIIKNKWAIGGENHRNHPNHPLAHLGVFSVGLFTCTCMNACMSLYHMYGGFFEQSDRSVEPSIDQSVFEKSQNHGKKKNHLVERELFPNTGNNLW